MSDDRLAECEVVFEGKRLSELPREKLIHAVEILMSALRAVNGDAPVVGYAPATLPSWYPRRIRTSSPATRDDQRVTLTASCLENEIPSTPIEKAGWALATAGTAVLFALFCISLSLLNGCQRKKSRS